MAFIRQNMELVSDKGKDVTFTGNVAKGMSSFAYALSNKGQLEKTRENRWIFTEAGGKIEHKAPTLPFFTPNSMNKIILAIGNEHILYIDDEGKMKYEDYTQEDVSKTKKDI